MLLRGDSRRKDEGNGARAQTFAHRLAQYCPRCLERTSEIEQGAQAPRRHDRKQDVCRAGNSLYLRRDRPRRRQDCRAFRRQRHRRRHRFQLHSRGVHPRAGRREKNARRRRNFGARSHQGAQKDGGGGHRRRGRSGRFDGEKGIRQPRRYAAALYRHYGYALHPAKKAGAALRRFVAGTRARRYGPVQGEKSSIRL